MNPSFYIAAAICLATLPASAAELLLVGRVESIVVVARGAPGCINPADLSPEKKDGVTMVTVSNSCGCQETKILVDKTLIGQSPGSSFVLKTPLGEWCQPAFTVSMQPALIQVKDGSVWSARLDEGDRFAAKKFFSVAGVPAKSLPVDEQGSASLKDLMERVNDRH